MTTPALKIVTDYGVIAFALAKAKDKWCVYLEPGLTLDDIRHNGHRVGMTIKDIDDMYEAALKEACPWSTTWLETEFMLNDRAFVLFDTEAEARTAFAAVVGDNGPTETNSYDGIHRVYAMLVSPEVGFLTENT